MSASTTSVETTSVETTSVETTSVETTEQPQQETRTVTQEEFNRIKHQQKTAEKLAQKQQKTRVIRWKQPFANAKIEDLIAIAKDHEEFQRKVADVVNGLTAELYILQQALLKAGSISKEIIDEVRKYEEERSVKFNELKENTTMDKEEKMRQCIEWKIAPASIGLEEDVKNNS